MAINPPETVCDCPIWRCSYRKPTRAILSCGPSFSYTATESPRVQSSRVALLFPTPPQKAHGCNPLVWPFFFLHRHRKPTGAILSCGPSFSYTATESPRVQSSRVALLFPTPPQKAHGCNPLVWPFFFLHRHLHGHS